VIEQINPILRVNYFAIGDSSECFSFVRDWIEKKIRRHLKRARERSGYGWRQWSTKWLYDSGLLIDVSDMLLRPTQLETFQWRTAPMGIDFKTPGIHHIALRSADLASSKRF